MQITVNEQAQSFQLAFSDGWKSAVGHEIKVGDYRFCAIPTKDAINVSEITTGMKLFNVPLDFVTMLITETKEETIQFFHQVGERIKRIIAKQNNFDEMLEEQRKLAIERFGKMPSIEDVDLVEMGVSVDE